MSDVLKEIAANTILLTFMLGTVGVLAVTVTVVIVWAFVQGRSISFWPPSIGERRPVHATADTVAGPPAAPSETAREIWPPAPGSIFTTSSGQQLTMKRRIHVGNATSVYIANPLTDAQKTVILKALWVGPESDPALVKAFSAEARTTVRLKHQNVAVPADIGTYAGYPFLVMEYLGGGSLREWLKTHDRMRGVDILSVARQVFAAVDYAHSEGVIHRDIKPGNILFEANPQGRVVLSDFGIARLIGAAEIPISAVELPPAGTLSYISPEALRGEALSSATDIYSCGVVLYEMITGRVPFADAARSFGSMMHAILEGPPDIRSVKPEVTESIAARLAHTMSPDSRQRPGTAAALLQGVEDDILRLR